MPFNVTTGSAVTCTMSLKPAPPSVITAATPGPVTATAPVCTIMDFKPLVNIASFGACVSPTNPAVKPPTNAAPCVPVTTTPWTPGSLTTRVNGVPVLTDASTCTCNWGGLIAVVTPSQQFVAGT